MQKWLYKTDEAGRPRRFLGHGEAISWAALKIGRYVGPPLGFGVVAVIFAPLFAPQDLPREAILWLSLMVLILSVAAASGIYLCIALSGGVMSAEQRDAYRERLRESRRGRW